MPNVFFTSDTHFGHESIIRLCERPFESVEAMNEALIDNWNAKISKKDIVFHLGDFSMGTDTPPSVFAKRLNGTIHLIEGNHDQKTIRDHADCFASIHQMKTISVERQKIFLCHYPMREWDHAWRGTWHLFGHVHGRLDSQEHSKSLDVGVDSHGYKPLAFEELQAIMAERQNFPQFAAENSIEP
ncbi:MAG: phosphoesterase [Hyphomicrobiales bacterium]|nr:MAG: phosphoesterase [Hyphomicrobiales bacterium]